MMKLLQLAHAVESIPEIDVAATTTLPPLASQRTYEHSSHLMQPRAGQHDDEVCTTSDYTKINREFQNHL